MLAKDVKGMLNHLDEMEANQHSKQNQIYPNTDPSDFMMNDLDSLKGMIGTMETVIFEKKKYMYTFNEFFNSKGHISFFK
jgi:hypothetical protein